jgi:peroxiredoxin
MRHSVLFVAFILVCWASSPAQERAIVAQAKVDVAAAQFDVVLKQALGTLARAGSFAVNVESKWGATVDPKGPQGGSHYRLIAQEGRYRVEIQSLASQSPDLIWVNDGKQVTTYFPARKMYSQHSADSPHATLEANKMLGLSLQGSAIDILLQRDVSRFVQTQASGVKDLGESVLDGKKVRRFEVVWQGAKVELIFAAEGEPLLQQFIRTTNVPLSEQQSYQMVCTARFQWRLGEKPREGTFALALPSDAQRVSEIYDALAGQESVTQIGKPLPKLKLAKLDGSDVTLAAAADKKATVLIFWATWNTASVEDLSSVSKFVAENKARGVEFYAVNVGEAPGEVRRFTAKHPLVSAVVLDPRGSASEALHLCELPAVAVIGPDNTIRAILQGTSKELQGELASQLNGLLAGATSNTARRPGEGPARQK